jgi:hypothetical protein
MATLTACATEYHGYDSGIDGVLWRQIAKFEDPLSVALYEPSVNEPAAFLDALEGARWDGTAAAAAALDVTDGGGIVLYDISSSESSVSASVFIASGLRFGVPVDDTGTYTGPSEVYTCYDVDTEFSPTEAPSTYREILEECPEPLVELLADDAAFASGEVFDG